MHVHLLNNNYCVCVCVCVCVGSDPFGLPTLIRPWDDGSDSIENAKRRLRAAFEFFQKLGVSCVR